MSASRRPLRDAGGFTLLEVLVALAVVAIAMGALLSSGGNVALSASRLEDKVFAHWVANNRMLELRVLQGATAPRDQSGSTELAGRQWSWKQQVSSTEVDRVYKVEISVSDENKQPVTSLIGYLLQAAP